MLSTSETPTTGRIRVLVVAPYMHHLGHTATFPHDMALAFAANEADVTLACPLAPVPSVNSTAQDIRRWALELEIKACSSMAQRLWGRLIHRPFLQCVVWLIFAQRAKDFDVVFFTDSEPASRESIWYLQLARLCGPIRAPIAFAEHFPYAWNANRLGRLLRADRLRLRGMLMLSFSRTLLESNRHVMRWPEAGCYVPWGVWPQPMSDYDRACARQRLGISPDARVLLVFGMLSIRRKEIDTLAHAVKSLEPGRQLTVLFAGTRTCDADHPFDDAELRSKRHLTIRRVESFIDEAEVATYFAAADGIWAYYGVFGGASGVLLQAIGFGRLAITSDAGEIGELSRRHGVGLSVGVDNPAELRTKLSAFVDMSPAEQARHERQARDAASSLAWPFIGRAVLDSCLGRTTGLVQATAAQGVSADLSLNRGSEPEGRHASHTD